MKKCMILLEKKSMTDFDENSHTKWEFLNTQFTITYSKTKAKNSREEKSHLENKF